jgi:hypothetical protein
VFGKVATPISHPNDNDLLCSVPLKDLRYSFSHIWKFGGVWLGLVRSVDLGGKTFGFRNIEHHYFLRYLLNKVVVITSEGYVVLVPSSVGARISPLKPQA